MVPLVASRRLGGTWIKPVAPLVLAALLPGCRGGGAFLLGTAVGASVVTAAVVSRRPRAP
jgi:hypothetical protein